MTPTQACRPLQPHPSTHTHCPLTPPSLSHLPLFSQLLLTGTILIFSALIASLAAAAFYEQHTAPQLLGLVAAPPDPRWNVPKPPAKLPQSLESSSSAFASSSSSSSPSSSSSSSPPPWGAAVDFALGAMSGALGTMLLLLPTQPSSPNQSSQIDISSTTVCR